MQIAPIGVVFKIASVSTDKCQSLNISEAHEAKLQPYLKQLFDYKKLACLINFPLAGKSETRFRFRRAFF